MHSSIVSDSSWSSILEHPVWIVLNSAAPLPALTCIELIELCKVAISSRGLRSLLSILLTLDHEVMCSLYRCSITSSVQESDTDTKVYMEVLNNTIKSLGLERVLGEWLKHGELLSQSLSSLTQLETLTMQLRIYIVIQPPQSLKNVNIYCDTLLPSQLRKLMDTLRACTQTIDSRLEFGCTLLTYAEANLYKTRIQQIAPEEYIPIVQELETLENVAVNRFQILDRTRANTWGENDTCWSARSNGNIDDDKQNGDNFEDNLYTKFVQSLDNKIIHRISMRFLITPASTSRLSNQYGCNT
ncbi:hypothetical protein DPMN_140602 [Dreissena polymorpha]|uniref:Uncharacterized protein n=1 Tax=Dreissena polymorpha TaxID=45954 RepID=A0A9D4JKI7_DREPO|nr:hypothetical protein DPMN_140602 [Dreissena polymorpha]